MHVVSCQAASALGWMLRSNAALLAMDLSCNALGAAGGAELLAALQHNRCARGGKAKRRAAPCRVRSCEPLTPGLRAGCWPACSCCMRGWARRRRTRSRPSCGSAAGSCDARLSRLPALQGHLEAALVTP